ncbi:MAG: hypothetical protein LBN26_02170, partial [Christensenellaceae bacterium]|nr:hypothetical protein [Christensenellaceae bacterium]
ATAFAVNASKATGFVSDVNGTRTFNDDSATAGLDKSGAIFGGSFVIEDDMSVAVETIQVGESTESEADAIFGGNFTFDEGTLNISFDQK